MQNERKVIFHVDMNAFFASCEVIRRPYLENMPFVVGARYTKKGVVSTANYPARKLGIHSAMSIKDALDIYPKLLVLDSDFEYYEQCSANFMRIFYQYTDLIEKASIDEAYLDMSHYDIDPLIIANELQKHILREAKLPCSIGIGPTLFLAKMASDIKKPLGITRIDLSNIQEILYHQSICSVIGIGIKTQPKLIAIGINTIKDFILYKDLETLNKVIGSNSYYDIYQRLTGKSTSLIDSNRYSEAASIGNSRTFEYNLTLDSEFKERLLSLSKLVSNRMKKAKIVGNNLSILIKYADFTKASKSKKTLNYTNDYLEIYEDSINLFYDIYNESPIRLLGVTLSNLQTKNEEFNLFSIEDNLHKDESLNETIKNLKNKYGNDIIKRGF